MIKKKSIVTEKDATYLKDNKIPPPVHYHQDSGLSLGTKPRESNLELYRIVCMLMIVAHHYVVNSRLFDSGGPLVTEPTSANSLYLALFGAWGKVGINCFLMITGYYMCTSHITFRKFLKLMLQIYFYKLLLFPILLIAGYEKISLLRIFYLIMPVRTFATGDFVSCFIAFWLTIPFLNRLIQNLKEREHAILILLSLLLFTLFGSIPTFSVPLNYITWFGVIYFIASFFRLYPHQIFECGKFWGGMTLLILIISLLSVTIIHIVIGQKGFGYTYYFMRDSNKINAVAFAVSSFLWFKNLNIGYSKVINAFGAGTFGVLLIHANSTAMRKWLWMDAVDCVGHYDLPLFSLMLYSVGVVVAIFVTCNLIDQLRIATIEKWFFNWYDKKYASKADSFVNKLLIGE